MHVGAEFLSKFFMYATAPVCVTSLANERSASKQFPPRAIYARNPSDISDFIKKFDVPGRACYFCVSTVLEGETRNKKNLAEHFCLHTDLDFKDIDADLHKIKGVIEQLQLKPSAVVWSGHGVHLYWLFHQPLKSTEQLKKRIEAALRALCSILARDPAVYEVARIMRIPASHNSKHGDWIEVETQCVNGQRFLLEELEDWIFAAQPVLTYVGTTTSKKDWQSRFEDFGGDRKTIVNPEAELEAMRYHGPHGTSIHETQLRVVAHLMNTGEYSIADI